MARATGIEITGSSVRVVEIEGTPKRFKIARHAECALDEATEDRDEAVLAALRAALKESKAHKDHVVFGLPAREAVIREITIPFTDTEQIRKVIKFESESHLHGVDIEDVVVDFQKVAQIGPRSRVMVIAARKDSLRRYLKILERAGIDPASVDIDAAGLFARASSLSVIEEEDEGAYAVVDLGETTSTILVGHEHKLRVVRCMRLGRESMNRQVARDLGIDEREARTVTLQMFAPDEPFAIADGNEAEPSPTTTALAPTQTAALEQSGQSFHRKVITELTRSLSSAQLEGKVQGIYLTGPSSVVPGLPAAIEEHFGVRVAHLDALENTDSGNLEYETSLGVLTTCGLALKQLGRDPLGLEFRREDLRYTRKFDKLQMPLLLGGLLFATLFVVLGIQEWWQIKADRYIVEQTATASKKIYRDMIATPASQDPKISSILGYENQEEALTPLKRIEGGSRPMDKWSNDLLRQASQLSNSVNARYGIKMGEENAGSPEMVTRSALFRLNQFLGAVKEFDKEVGRGSITLQSLHITTKDIKWSMRYSDAVPDLWQKLENRLRRLDEIEEVTRGDRKVLPEPGFSLFDGCSVVFEEAR